MSDAPAPTETAAAAAAADTGAAPEPAPAPAPAPEPAADPGRDTSVLDGELEQGIKQFPREYVEKLRAEAAKHRTAAREAQEAREQLETRYKPFESYDDSDMRVWSQLATDWQTDPRSAAATMRQIASNVLQDPSASPADKAEAADQIAEIDKAEQTGQTTDVEKMIEERIAAHDRQQKLNEGVAQIDRQLAEAGHERGTFPYSAVLWFATNDPETNGDIGKSLEKFNGFKQSVIDEYVESVKNGSRTPVGTAADGVTGSPTPSTPTNIKEASAAARKWLEDRDSA